MRIASALGFTAVLLTAGIVHAGEIKFGSEVLEVDGEGKLTDKGRGAAKEEIPSRPNEEIWDVHLWAKLDKPAPGGLSIEFYGDLNGKPYLAYRHSEESFDGGKYLSIDLELEGSQGFNKGKTYKVEITQQDAKGKDFKLASGKIKLVWNEVKEEPKPEAKEDGKEDAQDSAAQDAIDTISGGDGGGDGNTGAPPKVEGKKKGCSIDSDAGIGIGMFVLLVLGIGSGRRRA